MATSEDTQKRAVVLLSGGLDSATVAACLIRDGFHVTALSIDYGQRHAVELKAATTIAHEVGVNEHRIMKLDLRAFGGSALTDESLAVPKADDANVDVPADIPITYVPARNTIFLSLALGLAEAVGAYQIGIGVNALDYSGYPDCRPEFVNKFGELANLATREGVEGRPIHLYTPLLDLSKVEILKLAHSLNVPVDKTISCYDPDEHGTPCALCDSCRLRSQAQQELCL
ncbi:MAG: 7-cyano-7-deazaguanine synthase QueC [Planctomycetes bacterium]|nr:7-cyano-7-deazaguanine synthase QueC [Planctomycetota bacterium]